MTSSSTAPQAGSHLLDSPPVAGVRRLSAVGTVIARIGLAIELSLLKPGEMLPSDESVAVALDVSTITVRRALQELARRGVLVRRRGRTGGTFVADTVISESFPEAEAYRAVTNQIRHLIDTRALAECTLAHYASLNATPGDIAKMQRAVDDAAHSKTWAEYHAADERFHLALAEASKQDWAIEAHAHALGALYRYFLPYPIEHLHGSNEDHQRIVDAIVARDGKRAVEETRQHALTLHDTMFISLSRS